MGIGIWALKFIYICDLNSWPSGGTGIRAALKMLFPQGIVGSSPT